MNAIITRITKITKITIITIINKVTIITIITIINKITIITIITIINKKTNLFVINKSCFIITPCSKLETSLNQSCFSIIKKFHYFYLRNYTVVRPEIACHDYFNVSNDFIIPWSCYPLVYMFFQVN
jgi:hypothetical protein